MSGIAMSMYVNWLRPGRLAPSGSAGPLAALAVALLLALGLAGFAPPASAACPNEAIREQQGSTYLPDCMAFEMVSSPLKSNQSASNPTISPDGDRILYFSRAALGETPGLVSPVADPYVASRDGSGWTTMATVPPVQYGIKGLGTPTVFSADLGSWLAVAPTEAQGLLGQLTVLQGGISQPWLERVSALTPLNGPFGTFMIEDFRVQGASADLSRFFFNPGAQGSFILPGDPEPGSSAEEVFKNTYVLKGPAGASSLELLARDMNGKVWGGTCGAWLGGGLLVTSRGGRNQGAISPDGSRAYFSTRPAQPQTEPDDPASPPCDTSNPIRILEREETPGGVAITELIPGGLGTGDDKYQGASTDGSKVYFTSPRKFLASDQDIGPEPCGYVIGQSKGCDLYLYDTDTGELIQVSAGDASAPTPGVGANVMDGVTDIATDGSRVYFVAQGVLTTNPNPEGDVAEEGELNLYLYQRDDDHPAGRTAFIARLDKNCGTHADPLDDCSSLFGRLGAVNGFDVSFGANAITVPMKGTDAQGNEVGGDGRVLVFQSFAALTDDDQDGLRRDVFRYDSVAETLVCVSCAGNTGEADDFDVSERSVRELPKPNFAEYERWSSETGDGIVFATSEPLLPGDDDEAENPYFWRNGELVRLPGERQLGISGQALKPTISADGAELAFQTASPLVPADGDSAEDVYVARASGGFPAAVPTPICAGEACQGGPSSPPAAIARLSETVAGPGNVQAEQDRCARISRRATRLKQRAKRLSQASRRANNAPRKRQLNRQARALRKRASRASRSAKRCRASDAKRVGANRGGLR